MLLTRDELDADEVIQLASSPKAGGTVSFVGTVRDNSDGSPVSEIELESAQDMALQDLVRIGRAAISNFKLCKLVVRHRIGRLKVGDKIIIIAVSAPHRDEAFQGCRFVIDELKKTTPIWKKEIGPAGNRWAEGRR